MKKSIKITVASISALVLAVACIVAAPLLKDVLNDIVNPAYRETVIFPDNGRANPKDTTICIDGIEIRMIGVRGGKIHCEGLRHEFEIEDFYLGETEVTQELWKAVMGDNPAINQGGDDYPVENVDLVECFRFMSRLDSLSGVPFTLPSYPVWLYGIYLGGHGDSGDLLEQRAWYEANSGSRTHSVKQKQADALGLYDMLGNVAEWTISGSDPLFFTVGGSYESDKVHCSAGMMDMAHGDVALGSLGLRLAIPAYKLNQLPYEDK